jgi:hypothetical protein
LGFGALVACGGAPPAPAPQPQPPPEPRATRVPIEDTEPDEGITVINAHGHMEKEAIEAGLAPHNQELADCYMKRVGRRRWLGGHVKIHWDIAKDGTITKVKLAAESDLGAWPIEKCLLEVARAASFDKPIGGDADFDIPLDFTAKGNFLPWDEDQALRAVGGQLAKLDACGTKIVPPDDVVVTVYVGARGRAQSVGFSSDKSEIDDKWADCAVKAALKWRLPDPRGLVAKLAIRYRSK